MVILHALVGLLALTLPISSLPLPPRDQPPVCNGHAELCSRSYGNVTFIGAHDSFAYSLDPAVVSRDQDYDIPFQMSKGVRLLQAQAHMFGGGLRFCHTNCFLYDGGPVLNYLTKVKTFLDQNPTEVLTLLFTNPDGASVSTVWKPIFDQAGLTPYMYVPPHLPMRFDEWPTLGDMIQTGKRVVMFMDADSNPSQVDFILPEFKNIWETPYGITNSSFPCSIDRMKGPLSAEDHMYMINHSLNKDIFGIVISDPWDASTTNGVTSILNNAYGCGPLGGGRAPNFLLLDFVDLGDAFHAANVLNGVVSLLPISNGNALSNLPRNRFVQYLAPLIVVFILMYS